MTHKIQQTSHWDWPPPTTTTTKWPPYCFTLRSSSLNRLVQI